MLDKFEEVALEDLVRSGGSALIKDGDWIESKDQDPTGSVRLIQLADIGDGIFKNVSNRFLTSAKAEELRCTFLRPGDLLIARMPDPIGRCAIFPDVGQPAVTAVDVCIIRPSTGVDREWLKQAINTPQIRYRINALAGGGTRQRISTSELRGLKLFAPELPEQRKIAEILRTWDEALEKLTALRAAKVRRISSLRQRLFEAEYASHNRLQRAKDLFETVSERARPDLPLLAVMQDIGIVRRDELDRRVAMPDGDTSTYKVVRPGDFVISLRSFEGGLEYSSVIGLVSPAYTVLRPATELIGDYYRHFFKSRSFIGRLDKLIFGIRDGKQIAFRDFGDMYIPAPPIADQEAHARALGSLEADLALEDERIAALTRQKRGLMQKLLTGEWRVTQEAPVA